MKKIDKNFNKLQGLMSKEVILYFRKPQIINGFKVYSTVLTYDQFIRIKCVNFTPEQLEAFKVFHKYKMNCFSIYPIY
mgnify:CR=1 FL=1